jgi:hypothetical protein
MARDSQHSHTVKFTRTEEDQDAAIESSRVDPQSSFCDSENIPSTIVRRESLADCAAQILTKSY